MSFLGCENNKVHIRTKAIVSLINSHEVLLMDIHDPGREVNLYRPIGGSVEFGELLIDAAKREMLEEIGLEIDHLEFMSSTENLFEFNHIPAHEIVFHFIAYIENELRAKIPEQGTESDGSQFQINWYSKSSLDNIRDCIVPKEIYGEVYKRL